MQLVLGVGLKHRPLTGAAPPFVPTALSGLKLWLDAADSSTITHTSGSVSQWSDKSGQGNHYAQANGANQPQTGVAAINGHNVLSFNGTSSFMTRASFIQALAAKTIFVVLSGAAQQDKPFLAERNTGANQPFYQLGSQNSSPFNKFRVFMRANSNAVYNSHEGSAVLFNSNPNIFLNTDSKSAFKTWINGVPDLNITYTDPGTTLNTSVIGSNGVNTYNNSKIAEIIIYDSVLSDTDKNAVGNYLHMKWGASWTVI